MKKINTDNLEKALDSKESVQSQISKDSPRDTQGGHTKWHENLSRGENLQAGDPAGPEEIGFHKGALNTLVNERNELFKMMQNVEGIMQAHLKRLEELGIKK